MQRIRMFDQKGFTLIELLITLVVLSFGLLGLAGLQVGMVRANAFNKDLTIATSIGTDLIEEAKAAGAFRVLTLFNPSTPALYGDTDGDGVVDRDFSGDRRPDDPYNGRFTWTRTSVIVDPTGMGRSVKVAVSVFWPNPGGAGPHQSDLTTVIR